MKKIALIVAVLMLGGTMAQASRLKLETIGALGGANLYLTYVSIGLTADAYQNKAYNARKASKIVREVLAIAKVSQRYLRKLISRGELTSNDSRFARRMITTYSLLLSEGNAFVQYVTTKDGTYVRRFHRYRRSAWSQISSLLGLKK